MRATWLSRRRLLLPGSGRLPGGLWAHAACRPLTVFANTLSGHLIRLSVRLVPSSRTDLTLPFDDQLMAEILDRVPGLRRDHDWVVLTPSDPRRSRIMILGLDGMRRQTVFVRATLDEPNLLALRLLEQLQQTRSGLVYPMVEDVFSLDEWWITVERPLPQASHRPARLDARSLHELAKEIQALAPPRDGLVCGHGDLGPWNVRRYADGRLGVLDWEYATWSTRATDELWYALTLPLATTDQPGKRIGQTAIDALGEVYGEHEVREAAEFLVTQRTRAEPAEIREGVERSKSLLAFEDRLVQALSLITD